MEFLFTQEQYKEIEEKVTVTGFLNIYNTGLYDSLSGDLRDYIFWKDLEKEAMELANPNTRESAKLKYVEPVSEYTWHEKDGDRFINFFNGKWYLDSINGQKDKFTEEEIDTSPFNKEFFTKEK